MKKTSTFQNGLIWFGAGVSLAEILTGTSFAPLGMAKGFAAILIGHIIGCAMMLLAGLIGGRTGRSAMETVKMSFGQKGGLLVAFSLWCIYVTLFATFLEEIRVTSFLGLSILIGFLT